MMKSKRNIVARAWKVALGVVALIMFGGGSLVIKTTTSEAYAAPAPSATATTCTSGQNEFTIENENNFPIWLGEFVGDPTKIVEPSTGWELNHGASVSLCTDPPWSSGRFWARTGCDFTGLYQSGDVAPASNSRSGAFTTCTADTDCAALASTTGLTYDCMGGACVVDCTAAAQAYNNKTSTTSPDDWCQGKIGPSGETAAICTQNDPWSKYYCTYNSGYVCKTGDCAGFYQCEGNWTNGGVVHTQQATGAAPASLFEPTTTSASVVNYDLSNVGGYNMPIVVMVSPQPSASDNQYPNNCYAPACVSDLNQDCPYNLQITQKPTASGPVACGGGTNLYCQSGACVDCTNSSQQNCDSGGTKTCVIGCNDPGDQCALSPLPLNAANLDCSSPIATPSPTPGWTADNSTYDDMYEAANKSGNVDPNNKGTAMSSQNQGNPLCWTDPSFANADIDCAPNQFCDITDFTSFLPSGVGVCVYKNGSAPPGDTGGLAPQANCDFNTQVGGPGQQCGGYWQIPNNNPTVSPPLYPNALGYECQSVTIAAGGYDSVATWACLPAVNGNLVVGLGDYETPQNVTPPSAPLYTGSGSELNPEWQYAAKWATGQGTPDTVGTPFYEYFSKACPYAYGWTYDDNAGGFSCNTAAPGLNNAPVNFTVIFGAAAGLGATPGPNPGPVCSPGGYDAGYLITNPIGTLSFPSMNAGAKATETLTVVNYANATLKLRARIKRKNTGDFSLIGGTCKTNRILAAGASCTYEVKLKADKDDAGGVVSTLMKIKGRFTRNRHSKPHRVCPRKDFQGVTVTLAGYVNPR